jgi:hypothetical protein
MAGSLCGRVPPGVLPVTHRCQPTRRQSLREIYAEDDKMRRAQCNVGIHLLLLNHGEIPWRHHFLCCIVLGRSETILLGLVSTTAIVHKYACTCTLQRVFR